MNDENATQTAPVPAAPKAKKAAKKAKAAKAAKEVKLNTPQTWILKTLAKAKGPLSRREIAERAGKAGCATSKGRISDEAGNYGYLVKAKLVEFHDLDIDGKSEWAYEIKPAGRKALESAK